MCSTIVNNIVIHVMSKRWKESIYKSLNVVSLEFGGAKSVFVTVLAQVHPLQGFKMAAVEASVRMLNSTNALSVRPCLHGGYQSVAQRLPGRMDASAVAFRSPLHHA